MSVHRLRRPLRSRWWLRVLVVAAGLGGVWFALYPSGSNSEVALLVAKHDIFVGDALSADDFETKSVTLGESAARYLRPGNLPVGSLARREILSGELAAKTAIGLPEGSLVPLAVTFSQSLPHQVIAGRKVDVWATAVHLGQVDDAPQPIALGAIVTALNQTSSMGQTRTTAELMVSSTYVSALLLAQADGSVISLVLNPTAADG